MTTRKRRSESLLTSIIGSKRNDDPTTTSTIATNTDTTATTATATATATTTTTTAAGGGGGGGRPNKKKRKDSIGSVGDIRGNEATPTSTSTPTPSTRRTRSSLKNAIIDTLPTPSLSTSSTPSSLSAALSITSSIGDVTHVVAASSTSRLADDEHGNSQRRISLSFRVDVTVNDKDNTNGTIGNESASSVASSSMSATATATSNGTTSAIVCNNNDNKTDELKKSSPPLAAVTAPMTRSKKKKAKSESYADGALVVIPAVATIPFKTLFQLPSKQKGRKKGQMRMRNELEFDDDHIWLPPRMAAKLFISAVCHLIIIVIL
jgi:hypothetical protein